MQEIRVGPYRGAMGGHGTHALGLGQWADVFGGLAEDVRPELDLGAIHLLSQSDAEFAEPLVSVRARVAVSTRWIY